MFRFAGFLCFFFFNAFGTEFVLNKDHSDVLFEIDYLITQVQGRFVRFEGHFDLDPEKNTLKNLAINIDSASISTGNAMRDGHLRRKEFFDVVTYPHIIFNASSAQLPKDDSTFIVQGKLGLRGMEKSFPLKVRFLGKRSDTWGKEALFFEFQGEISRKDFGIVWNKTLDGQDLLLGDKVHINGHVQAQPRGAVTASSFHMIPDNAGVRAREQLNREGKLQTTLPVGTLPKVEKDEAPKLPLPATPPPQEAAPAKGTDWETYGSFFVLSTFGFMGALFLSYQCKQFLLRKLHQEDNDLHTWKDYLGDMALMAIMLLFCVSLYSALRVFY